MAFEKVTASKPWKALRHGESPHCQQPGWPHTSLCGKRDESLDVHHRLPHEAFLKVQDHPSAPTLTKHSWFIAYNTDVSD